MDNTIKVTFVGDIMCGIPELEHCQKGEDEYDFSSVFSKISDYLRQSDYVCGNLETPLADHDLNYTSETTLFNTPSDFARAVYESGINMVTTANNHCLDRGVEGLKRTIKNLEKIGIEYTGTNKDTSAKRYIVKDFGNIKIAFISYTYGFDSEYRNNQLKSCDEYCVNYFNRPYKFPIEYKVSRTKEFLKLITPEIIKKIARNSTYLDCGTLDDLSDEKSIELLGKLRLDICNAKAESDIVVMCLHIGGQYNNRIGEYTKQITNLCLDEGCDVVIGNHPHCILPLSITNEKKLIAYAQGNFSFTPNWGYYVKDVFADYSVILSILMDTENKKIKDITYRFSKSVRNGNHSEVRLVSDLYNEAKSDKERNALIKDVIAIRKRLLGINQSYVKSTKLETILYENSVFDK